MPSVIEKLFQMHTKEKVEVGNTIWIDIDLRTARDFAGAKVVENLIENYEDNYIDDAGKTFFTFDCNAPANTIGYANNQQICREFARKNKIKVFDVNRGIGSHVVIEEGLAYPGITAVGTDSHFNILGAIGAFGQGMGDVDIAFVFKTGKIWFEVPPTVKVNFVGMPDGKWSAKDLALLCVKELKNKVLGKSIEFYGDILEKLSMAGRITLSSMVTEMGGIIGFIPPNKEVISFCKKRSGKKIEPVYADKDANYEMEIDIDVSDLEPLIALPGNPANVKRVSELPHIEINSVFIGSCTNGRVEDIVSVSKIIKGRKISENVMMKIVPATREVWQELLEKGVIKELFSAGAIISHAGCGGCASGQIGMTGRGEVQVSTSNRNFKGKQGAGDTYLASPETAAVSSLLGYIGGIDEYEAER
ncbi:MAG TPA: 3-isopropylmalate dehydratase large subunit [Thermoplasmata archaeon]|nr:3-isopropylmalate dehydratase large subunit [Thermoplasmata archaeon]